MISDLIIDQCMAVCAANSSGHRTSTKLNMFVLIIEELTQKK